MLVGQGVDNGHGTGNGELQAALGVSTRPAHFVEVHGDVSAHGPDHDGHLGLVAVGADAHGDASAEVDAVEPLQETMDEVLAKLLSVGDDVDARRLLLLEGDQHGVALAVGEVLGGQPPWRP